MSTVGLCDGCGTFATSHAMGQIEIRFSRGEPLRQWELCPGCVADVMGTIGLLEHPLTPREKGYKEPYAEPTEDTVGSSTVEQLAAALFEKIMASNKSIEATKHDAGDSSSQ